MPKYLRSRKNLIDVGCGKLYFLDLLPYLKFKGKYLGIDIDPKKLQSTHGKEIKIIKESILNYKTTKKFDIAICLWVLEHIKEDEKAIERIYKILKPEGILLVAVPSIWTWPIEFGRHGFHYYSKSIMLTRFKRLGLHKVDEHDASGFIGLIFMLIYSWPRYMILVPALFFYLFLAYFKLTKKPWKEFSSQLVSKYLYFYQNSKIGIKIHNLIVTTVVKFDSRFRIFPASYIFVLSK